MTGVSYRFVIKEKELCLYADKILSVLDSTILLQVKEILELFYSILYKQEDSFHIRNVVLTKLYDDGKSIIRNSDLSLRPKNENSDIGLSIKLDKSIREDLFVYTYFLNTKDIKNFFNNLSKNIDRLYETTIKE